MNGNRVRPSRLSLGWAASQFDEKLFKVRRRGSLRRPLSSLMRSAASIAGKDGVDGERASAATMIEEVRFAADSPLEGARFEPSVPDAKEAAPFRPASRHGWMLIVCARRGSHSRAT